MDRESKFSPKQNSWFLAAVGILLIIILVIVFIEQRRPKITLPEPTKEVKVESQLTNKIFVQLEAPSNYPNNMDVAPSGNINIYVKDIRVTDTLKTKLFLIKNADNSSVDYDFEVEDSDFSKNGVNYDTQIKLDPKQELELGQKYKVVYNPVDLKDGSFVFEFLVADKPGFIMSNVKDGAVVPAGIPVNLTFKSPMSREQLLENMRVTVNGIISTYSLDLFGNNKTATIEIEMQPQDEINLIIPENTLDYYGNPLGEEINISFTVDQLPN